MRWFVVVTVLILILACLIVGVIVSLDRREPIGMDRFSPSMIEKHGCPDSDKIPAFMIIPECPRR